MRWEESSRETGLKVNMHSEAYGLWSCYHEKVGDDGV
jgi:hypothetical protein